MIISSGTVRMTMVQDAASANSKPRALAVTSATGTRIRGTNAPWAPNGMYRRVCIARYTIFQTPQMAGTRASGNTRTRSIGNSGLQANRITQKTTNTNSRKTDGTVTPAMYARKYG